MYLNTYDEKFLVSLYDMLFLDYDYLEKAIYIREDGSQMSRRWIYERVAFLEKEEYIKRSVVARHDGRGRSKAVFMLNTNGLKTVRELIGNIRWDARWLQRVPLFIHHALETAHIRAVYETEVRKDIAFYEWLSEKRAYFQYGQARGDMIQPDGTLIFKRDIPEKNRTAYFGYFVELERSRQRAVVSQKKLTRYNDYCRREAIQKHHSFEVPISLIRVLFISKTENEMHKLMEHTAKVPTPDIQAVLYSTYDQVLKNPYGAIWKAKEADREKKFALFQKIES